jgi:alginate O-acetyltransferase complex protein AlgJ
MSTATDPRRKLTGPAQRRPRLASAPARSTQEDLNRGDLRTDISHTAAWAMTIGFLALIFAVPVAQMAFERVRKRDIQGLEVLTRFPTRENLDRFEKDLSRQSFARQLVQPRVQLALSQYLDFGNANVLRARDGWLFYRPGVDFLIGPGLLDETRLWLRNKELSEAGESHPSPDPRPAILAFHEDCRKSGAHLVVVPVPDKAMLQPAELTSRFLFESPIEVPINPDYPRLLEDLRAAGVDVFDPTPPRLVPDDPPRFLRHDTHWTPGWMETVASDLASHLRSRAPLPDTAPLAVLIQESRVTGRGDLVDMLQLPPEQRVFPPQTVTIHRVLDCRGGAAWEPSEQADVLLLGDSFSNIYGAADLGWGDGAGFPAQLARFLNRPVDVITRNGSGATATRRELARRPDPLRGKRVVIWEFAVRDLALASWDVVRLPGPQPNARTECATESVRTAPLLVEGTILATSRVPQPFAVPYKDCLTNMKLRVEDVREGTYRDDAMIAVFWAMKDNVLLPAARYSAGQRLRLKVVPLPKAPVKLQSVRSVDDLDDYDHQPYYVLEDSLL